MLYSAEISRVGCAPNKTQHDIGNDSSYLRDSPYEIEHALARYNHPAVQQSPRFGIGFQIEEGVGDCVSCGEGLAGNQLPEVVLGIARGFDQILGVLNAVPFYQVSGECRTKPFL